MSKTMILRRLSSLVVVLLLILPALPTRATLGSSPSHYAGENGVNSTRSCCTESRSLLQEPASQIDGPLLVNTRLISFTITVMDPQGRFVSGLKKDAFTIYDDERPHTLDFFSFDDTPLSIGIVFDVSGSMSGERLERARRAITHFIQVSDKRDDYFLLAFNSRPQLLIDDTDDAGALLSGLAQVQAYGSTALLDAVYLAASKLQTARHERRALLLITDGGENSSRYQFNTVRRLLEESGAMLYSIGVLNTIDLASKTGFGAQVLLNELAKNTGGRVFFPQSEIEMDQDFENIALELRHQYSVGYKPNGLRLDGKWHHLKVAINPPSNFPRLLVRNRQGYFALPYPR